MANTEVEQLSPDQVFEQRVNRMLEMIQNDPEVRDRMLVEMYLALTDMERVTRAMMEKGPMKMFAKSLIGSRGDE